MQFNNYQEILDDLDNVLDDLDYVYKEDDYSDDDFSNVFADDDDDNDCIFVKRMKCWENTREICKTMNPPPNSEKVIYSNNEFTKRFHKSNVQFFNIDAIECAIEQLVKKLNPLVLNLADDCFAGGCVKSGSGAQEESLFRTTNYFQSLKQTFYPIKRNEAVYSPEISVIKTSEKTDWKLIDQNEMPKICFIACPGLKYPDTVTTNGEKILLDSDVDILKNKIKLIIQTAVLKNHDTIIFGALGCGAWKNPRKHVAEIFKEVLDEYDGVVLNYFFAIMNTNEDNYIVRDHDKGVEKTIDIFTEVFRS
jgi:uncharacterized protein (TIGR02452 family)